MNDVRLVKVSKVFEDLDGQVDKVNDDDDVNPWYGIGANLLDESHMEHLKNGGAIMLDIGGEYRHLLRMRRDTDE